MSLTKSKSQFFFHLATMYEAGVPLLNALATLRKQRMGWRLRGMVKRVGRRIQEGEGFADALRDEGSLFNDFEIELIAAGEETGHLDTSLHSLSEWLELVSKLRRDLVGGLAYPVFLVHAAVIVTGAVPLILGQMDGRAYLGRLLTMLGPIYLLFAFLGYVLPRLRRNVPPVAFFLDSLLMMIPVVRGVMTKLSLARFAQAFKGMVVSGVPLVYGLDRASRACGNRVVGLRIRRAVPRLKKGMGIADSLAKTHVLPSMGIEFIRTGEQSGTLDKMLAKVAELFASDAEFAIQQGARWLPVMVYLVIASIIGYTIVSMYGNIYAGYEDLLSDLPM